MDYGFGIDIGGTAVKLGLFTQDGALVEKWEIPTRTEEGGAYILPDMPRRSPAACTAGVLPSVWASAWGCPAR